jgi:hypothetical protein
MTKGEIVKQAESFCEDYVFAVMNPKVGVPVYYLHKNTGDKLTIEELLSRFIAYNSLVNDIVHPTNFDLEYANVWKDEATRFGFEKGWEAYEDKFKEINQ